MSGGDMIEIRALQIKDGWTVDDIETIEDCDDAFAVLTAEVVSIEMRLGMIAGDATKADMSRRAKAALRFKKAALQAVQVKRGQIGRALRHQTASTRDRRILELLMQSVPEAVKAAALAVDGGAA